uniref:EO2-4 n=1 Tax=Barramundi adomavirus TaxID=2609870 RepID=A0A6F9FCM8_9VIRU|nr:TPA_asm: EO2-4 [Barramundi adomavirus]
MLEEFFYNDLNLYMTWRKAKRKRKLRSIERELARLQIWMQYMIPFFMYNLSLPECLDRVRNEHKYRRNDCILGNWNLYLNTFPNLLTADTASGVTMPEKLFTLFRDHMGPGSKHDIGQFPPIDYSLIQLPRVVIARGPSFNNRGCYARQMFFTKHVPLTKIFLVFSTMFGATGGDVTRLYIFNSNLHNTGTGRITAPKSMNSFIYHATQKPPTHSICIGPCVSRTPDNKIKYIPKEMVFKVDLRSNRRLCCGHLAKICKACKHLLSFFATILCSALHELFHLNKLLPCYDGETGIFVICADKKLWSIPVETRKEMCTLLRLVLNNCAANRTLPNGIKGLVWRITQMQKSYLGEHITYLFGHHPMKLEHLHDLLELVDLPEGVLNGIRFMVESGEDVTADELAGVIIESLYAFDQTRVSGPVTRLGAFLRALFGFSFVCLDEVPLGERLYPAFLSVNPFTNSIVIPLTLCYLPCYSLDLMALPVMVCKITKIQKYWCNDERVFPTMYNDNCRANTLRAVGSHIIRYLKLTKRLIIVDCQLYHINMHYTKYDRIQLQEHVADCIRDTLKVIEEHSYQEPISEGDVPQRPPPRSWFGSIFKQYSREYCPFDTSHDQHIRTRVIETLKNDSLELKPLRLSHRLLRSLVLTNNNCILVNCWGDFGTRVPPVTVVVSPTPKVNVTYAPFNLLRPNVPDTIFKPPFINHINRFTESELRILSGLSHTGFHKEELRLFKRMRYNSDQGRSGQAPLGLSSGEDYSDTSSVSSSLDSEYDLHNIGKGNSVDHFELFVKPAGITMVLTVMHLVTEKGREITGNLRSGMVCQKFMSGIGFVNKFVRSGAYIGLGPVRARSTRRARRLGVYTRSNQKHRRAKAMAHLQDWRDRSMTVPEVELPPQAFFRECRKQGEIVNASPHVKGPSKKKKVLKTSIARTMESTYLTRKAYRGAFGQYRCYPNHVNGDAHEDWARDSIARTNCEDVLTTPNTDQVFSRGFRSHTPLNRGLVSLRSPRTPLDLFKQFNFKRVLTHNRSSDSGSEWADQENVQEGGDWPSPKVESTAVRALKATIHCGQEKNAYQGVTVSDSGADYITNLVNFDIDGKVVYPSSESDEENMTIVRGTEYNNLYSFNTPARPLHRAIEHVKYMTYRIYSMCGFSLMRSGCSGDTCHCKVDLTAVVISSSSSSEEYGESSDQSIHSLSDVPSEPVNMNTGYRPIHEEEHFSDVPIVLSSSDEEERPENRATVIQDQMLNRFRRIRRNAQQINPADRPVSPTPAPLPDVIEDAIPVMFGPITERQHLQSIVNDGILRERAALIELRAQEPSAQREERQNENDNRPSVIVRTLDARRTLRSERRADRYQRGTGQWEESDGSDDSDAVTWYVGPAFDDGVLSTMGTAPVYSPLWSDVEEI